MWGARATNLIFCDTPYQVFNALNIVFSNVEACRGNTDLVIYHQFAGSGELSRSVKETGLFCCVYDIYPRSHRHNYLTRGVEMLKLLFPHISLLLMTRGKYMARRYQRFWVASINNNTTLNFYYATNCAELVFYEDGLRSYGEAIVTGAMSNRLAGLLKLRHPLKGLPAEQKLYVHFPAMCAPAVAPEIRQLPALNAAHGLPELAKTVFAYREGSLYGQKSVIYLDQPYDALDLPYLVALRRVTALIEQQYGDRLLVRTHPRQTENLFAPKFIDDGHNIWELECLEQVTDHSILLSYYSTAACQPKSIAGKEPFVIFLYKVLPNRKYKDRQKELDAYVGRFAATYRDQTRVCVPLDLDDLEKRLAGYVKLAECECYGA